MASEPQPTIHDWGRRGFGNDYIFRPITDGLRASMTGRRLGLKSGDVADRRGMGAHPRRRPWRVKCSS